MIKVKAKIKTNAKIPKKTNNGHNSAKLLKAKANDQTKKPQPKQKQKHKQKMQKRQRMDITQLKLRFSPLKEWT